jgi:hypothetical protein
VLQPDLDALVAHHARTAVSLGLKPIVHIRTHWNSGISLRMHRGERRVQHALRAWYLIEIDMEDYSEATSNRWGRLDILCGYAQTLHAVAADGSLSPPSATPGKFGPQTAAENALMLESFRKLSDESEGRDRWPCEQLAFKQPSQQ